MRRPGPLPPPERDRAGDAPTRPSDAPAQPTGDSGRAGEQRRPRAVLPLRPKRAEVGPAVETPPHEVDAAPADGASAAAPSAAPGAGWRHVWRATRARRRALRAEIRRFTGRARRRRMAWITGVAAVLLLVVGSVGAAYSPLFAVQRIVVVGAEAIDDAALQEALGAQLGRPLPTVDHSEVKAALVAFPLIETYTLEARPPHELVVRIVERTPVGVVRSEAGVSTVDAAGVVLSTGDAGPEGLPEIDAAGGLAAPAFAAAAQVLRSLPEDVHARVATVRAGTPDDVTLILHDGTEVLWGSADDSVLKAAGLEAAPEGHHHYDVSSPGAIVVR
ncbi:FtsQ-type POTRA domain-containing protein [Microbacterium album]|uniref:POTRA domain-containing protein n=1 Tax=Microbacterium album TaxID=2053191 RepID=A0A917MLE7_9MICO|nr:FtsQ-type POTRA domain-containing protein [Microbacterium album]GGH40376.1 hypothetical protein GCM10010921_12270 [Microbacterium album]